MIPKNWREMASREMQRRCQWLKAILIPWLVFGFGLQVIGFLSGVGWILGVGGILLLILLGTATLGTFLVMTAPVEFDKSISPQVEDGDYWYQHPQKGQSLSNQ